MSPPVLDRVAAFTDGLIVAINEFIPASSYVGTARFAVDVGTYFGVRVEPVLTTTVVMSPEALRSMAEDNRIMMDEQGRTGQYIVPAHIILQLGEDRETPARFLVDFAIGHLCAAAMASGSKVGLDGIPVGGLALPISRPPFKPGDVLNFDAPDGARVVYRHEVSSRPWTRLPAWRKTNDAQRLAGAAIRAMRTR